MTLSRAYLFATIPLFALGVIVVVKLALGLARFTRQTVVASLPVVAEQSLVLPSDDRYAVFVQGKLGERGLGDFRFTVTSEDGREVRVSPVLARTSATSLDGTTRLELFAFSAQAGRHVIRTVGINPAHDYGQNRVVIALQRRAQLVARIVGLVLAGVVTIAALVASGIVLAGRR